MDNRIVCHIDFDYFFAQCEEIRNPELKTKPVVVCVYSDRGGDSGAIATANYIARNYGVKSGMPIKFAKKKLSESHDAVFLPTDFEYYTEISEKAMSIIREFGDIFEYVGKDEAYIDISEKTSGDFDKASHLAQQLKNTIRNSLKLSCTVGISSNKLVAKIASNFRKPDGLTVVPTEKIGNFLNPLSIGTIPGIGKKTEEKFNEMGLETIAQLKKLDVFSLNSKFGRKIGTYIFNSAKGVDAEPVTPRQEAIQYSRIITLKHDSKEFDILAAEIEELCNEIHSAVIADKITFRSIGIQFVQSDLSSKTKSRTLKNSSNNIDELKRVANSLLQDSLQDQQLLVRRIGVRISDLSKISGQNSITRYF